MSKQEPVNEHKRSSMMTRDEWMAWLEEAWTEAQKIAANEELRPMPSDQDARLIAAAPDLLEACLAMVTSFHGVEWMETHMQESIAMGRAAIAKARGEQ